MRSPCNVNGPGFPPRILITNGLNLCTSGNSGKLEAILEQMRGEMEREAGFFHAWKSMTDLRLLRHLSLTNP